MTPKTPPPKATEPVTGTGRIRWTDDPSGQATGYVGTLSPCVFRIWEPEDGDSEWLLTAAALPGEAGKRLHGPTPDDLKAEAERWLERFVSSLGAVFPEPAHPAERPGKRKLGDADILDAFRTVTNWSDAEVLHYESCDWCDPFASVVCEASPLAVKLAGHDREAAPAAGED